MFVLFISLFHYKFHYRIALTGNVESWLPTCGRDLGCLCVGDHLTHHVETTMREAAVVRSVVPFGRKSRYAELLSIPVCSAAIDAVPSSRLAAIMVNKLFIRINFNLLVLCCKFIAHRARCVHFITQQKLTNHYNKNSTIKAKPLIFSGLALFFTFFKPRHPISVKKLRANRRFPPFSLRERRRRLPSQGHVYPAAALFPQQFGVGKRLEDAHQFGVAAAAGVEVGGAPLQMI